MLPLALTTAVITSLTTVDTASLGRFAALFSMAYMVAILIAFLRLGITTRSQLDDFCKLHFADADIQGCVTEMDQAEVMKRSKLSQSHAQNIIIFNILGYRWNHMM